MTLDVGCCEKKKKKTVTIIALELSQANRYIFFSLVIENWHVEWIEKIGPLRFFMCLDKWMCSGSFLWARDMAWDQR